MPRIAKKRPKKWSQDGSLRQQKEIWLENTRLRGWTGVKRPPFEGLTKVQRQCEPTKGWRQSLKKDSKKEKLNVRTRRLRGFRWAWGEGSGGETLGGIMGGQDTLQQQ